MVLDLWANWCPMCRIAAPGLVHAYERFKSQGVAFVSLTDMPEPTVAGFVEQFDIGWQSGFGAPMQTVKAFGVWRPEQSAAGLDMAPAIYRIGPSDRVVWCDGVARYRHLDTQLLIKELEAQIEKALGEPAPGA